MDETSQKIIDATMSLVRDKGYVATTTKDIAQRAGVNECTLFRKFKNKKDIVLNGMAQEKWRANVNPEIFGQVTWDLKKDLELFMTAYMDHITPDFVNLSIGLRAPQLYQDTAPLIMKIPQTFLSALVDYFEKMEEKGKLPHLDFQQLAYTVFCATFGYTFLQASFQNQLISTERSAYIQNCAALLCDGIPH